MDISGHIMTADAWACCLNLPREDIRGYAVVTPLGMGGQSWQLVPVPWLPDARTWPLWD